MPVSTELKKYMEKICDQARAVNPRWAEVFHECFLNTLETTIERLEDGTTFVVTGDIPAMWLRDSTAQVRPYLVLAKEHEEIYDMIAGLVERQFGYILIDPYTNAFNKEPNGQGHGATDHTQMNDWIWERKYEIDSLAYAIQLAYLLYVNSGRTDHLTETVRKGLVTILDLWRTEQDHAGASPYRFVRDTDRQEDTLPFDGKGSPVGYTGMTWSGFRPSDDRCTYHYLVPSNQFASVVLGYVAELAPYLGLTQEEIELAATLKDQIQAGIERYGIIQNAQGQAIYAYEVDGLGNASIMDDGNVPNLLSLPYLGFCSEDDPIYVATRQTVLSPENPYYYSGKLASGLGSSHTWDQYIWPISLSMEGLTTSHKAEKARILDLLVNTDAGTNQMHESFHVDDDSRYTREWFSWSNMMFCELLLDYFDIRVKR
ncbi:MAG: glycoside hydrolase family 125 protein [Abiotrophia defectiva]|uniref:Glycoside hydrolase family 125 protein n=1 Tax=Abiotrophia defectiva TaxID=46125 RepID=A0A929MNA7_ABIDE|nr:glycoside hydrolase family 125 protein [Abiotrophia defectiva]